MNITDEAIMWACFGIAIALTTIAKAMGGL